jgi:hypothetical protein
MRTCDKLRGLSDISYRFLNRDLITHNWSAISSKSLVYFTLKIIKSIHLIIYTRKQSSDPSQYIRQLNVEENCNDSIICSAATRPDLTTWNQYETN